MTKHLSQSQIIPYLQGLTADGIEVTILSFEEKLADSELDRAEIARLAGLLSGSNIKWRRLRYHKRPTLPATVYDVLLGALCSVYIVLRDRIDVVHSRGYVPLPIVLLCKFLCRTRFVFDVRGLMAEEYVDAGHWKHGSLPFRITKWFEKVAFRHADAVIVLTNRVRELLRDSFPALQGKPMYVIPCCVDAESYPSGTDRAASRREMGISGNPVLAYVGSLGTWYMGTEMVELFKALLLTNPEATFLVLTQSPKLAHAMLEEQRIPSDRYVIKTVPPSEVPRWLSAADLAVAFIKPCFSKISSSPTKVGEYLAAGLPFISNHGIGDLDDLFARHSIGALVDGFAAPQYAEATNRLLAMLKDPTLHSRCRALAEQEFSMKSLGQRRYVELYRGLESSKR